MATPPGLPAGHGFPWSQPDRADGRPCGPDACCSGGTRRTRGQGKLTLLGKTSFAKKPTARRRGSYDRERALRGRWVTQPGSSGPTGSGGTTEVLSMTPARADKSAASTLPHTAGLSVAPRRDGNEISGKDKAGVEGAPETDTRRSRPAPAARVSRPRAPRLMPVVSDSHPFNDPCNYLG